MTMKMKAALWYGPGDIRIEEVSLPSPGPGEVLVKIEAALTCGTDFKTFRRGHAMLIKKTPSAFGHEMAGVIASTGKGVSSFKEGDRVVAANSAPCDRCFFCQKNQKNLCDNLEFLNGAFAEYLLVPARIAEKNLYHLPPTLSFRDAAATEPLASIVRCADQLNVKPGEKVCVIGSGSTGLLWVQMAKQLGAQVLCVARNLQKLETAKKVGADYILSTLQTKNVAKNLKEEVWDLTHKGYGPDVVIEAAGQPETWELATQLVRKGGRVSFYGGCKQGTTVTLDTHKLHYEELTLSGIFHHTPAYFKKALDLIAQSRIQIAPLIAGEKKLADIHQIFQKGVAETPLKFAVIP